MSLQKGSSIPMPKASTKKPSWLKLEPGSIAANAVKDTEFRNGITKPKPKSDIGTVINQSHATLDKLKADADAKEVVKLRKENAQSKELLLEAATLLEQQTDNKPRNQSPQQQAPPMPKNYQPGTVKPKGFFQKLSNHFKSSTK